MKIGILGTRGIPNHHGGFEQFAENFAVFAAQKGHEVFVYNSSLHPYKKNQFNQVKIIHCNDPEDKMGTAGQFIYDFNCIMDARKRNFDVLLQLGYTSNAIWCKLLPKNSIIITNMDGLEWKRSKYSKKVQGFLKYSEKLAVKSSDYLIADSLGIQSYLKENYNAASTYIAYGANVFNHSNQEILNEFNLEKNAYNMLIARMEPENNIEMILDGYVMSQQKFPFLVIGNTEKTQFGRKMYEKFRNNRNIRFLGAIYDQNKLENLRYFSHLYFHGHSVGGTNPSLLEAMASGSCIAANNNEFNAAILQQDAYYFESAKDVSHILDFEPRNSHFISNNLEKIQSKYAWNVINNEYLNFMIQACQ
ncbi:MAG: DUF1972 domain-containing protein [Flavobacteriaceae bacterium]|nr:DUF1972 domain-containing protein [Flavobacteriaceae bacterium]